MPKKKKRRLTKLVLKRKFKFNRSQVAIVAALVVAVGGYLFYSASQASANLYDDARQANLKIDASKGLNYTGLRAIKATANHPCKDAFEVKNVKSNGKPICSHGPDPAPDGIDVTKVAAVDKVQELNAQAKPTITTAQAATAYSSPTPNDVAGNQNTWSLSPTPCVTSGKKIQLVLLTDIKVSLYTYLAMNSMKDTAHRLEHQLAKSSAFSGPSPAIRQFRFATDSHCNPTVKLIAVNPTRFKIDTIEHIHSALAAYHQSPDQNTKYLIWNMASFSDICGIADLRGDSNPNQINSNNSGGNVAVVGQACWNTEIEIHELGHVLGAVQLDAPHTSGGYHCLDEHDAMCYDDNANGTAGVNGKPAYIDPSCQDLIKTWLYDCRSNDYFTSDFRVATNPTNYLHNHWNISQSAFMQ